jgi:hypothetical protein
MLCGSALPDSGPPAARVIDSGLVMSGYPRPWDGPASRKLSGSWRAAAARPGSRVATPGDAVEAGSGVALARAGSIRNPSRAISGSRLSCWGS